MVSCYIYKGINLFIFNATFQCNNNNHTKTTPYHENTLPHMEINFMKMISSMYTKMMTSKWDALPPDVQLRTLTHLSLYDFLELYKLDAYFHNLTEDKGFQWTCSHLQLTQYFMSPISIYMNVKDVWHVTSFNHKANIWQNMGPFSLPISFSIFSFIHGFYNNVGYNGLFCINVSAFTLGVWRGSIFETLQFQYVTSKPQILAESHYSFTFK